MTEHWYGVRTTDFIRRWSGHEKPKQYCAFAGARSMFQHTLDRAVGLTPWERIVVVAARHHHDEGWRQLHWTAGWHGAVTAEEYGRGRRHILAAHLAWKRSGIWTCLHSRSFIKGKGSIGAA